MATCKPCFYYCVFWSAFNPGRIEPHLQKYFPFALSSLLFFALRRLVADHELSDISVYLLRVQLR